MLKLIGGALMWVGGLMLVDDGLRLIRRRRIEAEEIEAEGERERQRLLDENHRLRHEARARDAVEFRERLKADAAAAEVKPA